MLTHYREAWSPELTWADIRWSHTWQIDSQWQKIATANYLGQIWQSIHDSNTSKESHQSYVGDQMLENVRRVLEQQLYFYDEHSISVILMPINPFYYQLSDQENNVKLNNYNKFAPFIDMWDDMISQYNALLIEVSQEWDEVYFFDTRPIMDAQNRNEMYIDFIHHSPEGNQVRANALFEFLSQNQLLLADN